MFSLALSYQSAWKKFHDWLPADTVSINQGLVLSYLVDASKTDDVSTFRGIQHRV